MKERSGVSWASLGITSSVCLVMFSLLFAGGPRAVLNNQALKWNVSNPDTFPVRYVIDNGPLGEGLSRDQGAALVRQGFQKWEDVSTSTMRFLDSGFLDMDIGVDNYQSFVFTGQPRPENPVIFDSDGSIIDDQFGVDAKESILGFAVVPSSDPETLEFLSGWMVLNGTLASEIGLFPRVMAHEIGHLMGLDHTQINLPLAFNSNSTDDLLVPLMFPVALPNGPGAPIRDDMSWISWMYPSGNFRNSTGTIQGNIMRRTGDVFQGANVVAVQVDAEGQESQEEVVSVVSSFLGTDGSYEIPGLTPGNYAVFIEPLHPLFVAESGVGPFDNRFTNFPKDYYNGANESGSGTDDPTERTLLSVGAGQALVEIDLTANEPLRLLSELEDDDGVAFQFTQGFTFPFFGTTFSEIFVNSDGNLTLGIGGGSTADRDEDRFLSGPARIAPLFTDLNPEEAGEVSASSDSGQVTFTWEDVPEFSAQGGRPANRFSVTLFESGDILFSYQTLDITPDDNLQAIVGISPGLLSAGNPVDLSSQESLIPIETEPIYEVFLGTSLDLAGQFIFFQASSNEFFFPFFSGDAENFSGYAITNLSPGTAEILIEARAGDGLLLSVDGAPDLTSRSIETQHQLAELGRGFFGLDIDVVQDGWLRMVSNTSQLGSFFQFGNGIAGPVTRMDGALAFSKASDVLFFTRLYDGASTFPTFGLAGPQDATTSLVIANPNDEAITLTLTLFGPIGQPFAQPVSQTLPRRGRLFQSLGTLFEISSPIADGFVRVDVEGPGAVGFALIEVQDTLLGFNASFGNEGNVLYSAQMASGGVMGNRVFTSLKVVNTSDDPRVVTITAYLDDGSPLNTVFPFTLGSGSTRQQPVGELFGTGSPISSNLRTGSIRVDADGSGVIGDVIFGDPGDPDMGIPNEVDFAAGLPLQTTLFEKAIFSQVANGATNPKDASTDTFTGIALYNPNSSSAQITVRVFDREGMLVGEKSLSLSENERISQLIEELIPETADLIGGHIVVESTRPIVGQAFFGNNTLQFLSAIPPIIVE
ncbi:MAG: hypothetical protein VYC91_03610 [Acidobacteriota bacterium]|nr:hypothetical protein [Acidobacteriota bacterium]